MIMTLIWPFIKAAIVGAVVGQIKSLPQDYQDIFKSSFTLNPTELVDAIADKLGPEWLQKPTYDLIIQLSDRIDGKKDYIKEILDEIRNKLS